MEYYSIIDSQKQYHESLFLVNIRIEASRSANVLGRAPHLIPLPQPDTLARSPRRRQDNPPTQLYRVQRRAESEELVHIGTAIHHERRPAQPPQADLYANQLPLSICQHLNERGETDNMTAPQLDALVRTFEGVITMQSQHHAESMPNLHVTIAWLFTIFHPDSIGHQSLQMELLRRLDWQGMVYCLNIVYKGMKNPDNVPSPGQYVPFLPEDIALKSLPWTDCYYRSLACGAEIGTGPIPNHDSRAVFWHRLCRINSLGQSVGSFSEAYTWDRRLKQFVVTLTT